jgi:hypothetical protein
VAVSSAGEIDALFKQLPDLDNFHRLVREPHEYMRVGEMLDKLGAMIGRAGRLSTSASNQYRRQYDAYYAAFTEVHFRLLPGHMVSNPWPLVKIDLDLAAHYAYDQDQFFPDVPGVCSTLSGIFLELRNGGMAVKDIMADKRFHPAILALQASDYVIQQHRGCGRGLLEMRYFKQVHEYCKAQWGGVKHCPTLIESGCFPRGMTTFIDQGHKVFAVRGLSAAKTDTLFSRGTKAPLAIRDSKVFKNHQLLSNVDGIVLALFNSAKRTDKQTLFMLYIYTPERGGWGFNGHVVVVDLTTGQRGIFDPNFGWIPLTKGWNDVLSQILKSLGATYKAIGMIAYAYTPTTRTCHCVAPREAKGLLR